MENPEKEDILEIRKAKIFSYFKKENRWYWFVLAVIAWFGYFIRTRNMPLLKDITTGKFIPIALDPHIFLRYVRYAVEHGSLMSIDCMRYYPWCFGGSYGGNMIEFKLLTYFIAYLYKFLHFFNSSLTVEYVHVIYPAIAFVISLVFFFLFVKKLFDYKIALLASAFLTVVPGFLYRTMAGFSDKEALGFVFMFAAFYFFVIAWQSKSTKKSIWLGAVAGLMTGAMGLVWGGFSFVITTIGLFVLFEVLLNRLDEENSYTYISWYVVFVLILMIFRGYSFANIIGSIYTALDTLALGMVLIDLLIFKKNIIKKKEKIERKIPTGIFSFLATILVGIVTLMVVFHPDFIFDRIKDVYVTFTNPFGTGRWALTVAEAHQPYLVDWIANSSWTYFWLFAGGSVLLFHNAIKNIIGKNAWKGTIVYLLFILGFTFSRYSAGSSVLNGTTKTALFIYLGSLIIFFGFIFGYYIYYFYKDKEKFHNISKIKDMTLFVLAWFIVMIVGARSASRLILVFIPVTAVLAGYLVMKAVEYSPKIKKDSYKITAYIIIFLVILSPFGSIIGAIPLINKIPIINNDGLLVGFAKQTYTQAKYTGPSYNQQWQYSMQWVRENTEEDSVFAHWWDYGYWVQTGGQRATVTDGGNAMTTLNHFMGRYVLTGQNEIEALEFLKAHDANYLLMISDEIGKYPAYSSIGSDADWDRYSSLQVFQLDKSNIQETRDELIYLYRGGVTLDEDFTYKGQLYPRGAAGVGGIFLPLTPKEDGFEFGQPTAVLIYNGQQVRVPLQCIFFDGQEINFPEEGLDGCLRMIPVINENGQIDSLSAGFYISPKVRRTLFTQLYLFGKEGKYFKEVYNDKDRMPLALYQGRIIGPLKIWKISYPSNLEVPEVYYHDILPDPSVESLEGRF